MNYIDRCKLCGSVTVNIICCPIAFHDSSKQIVSFMWKRDNKWFTSAVTLIISIYQSSGEGGGVTMTKNKFCARDFYDSSNESY